MSELSERDLETQLGRRRSATPLEHGQRVELIESIHARTATVGRESGSFRWRWLAGAAIATALVVVVSIALPRVVSGPTASPPSGVANSPTATYAASPPPIATSSPAPNQSPGPGIGVRLDERGVPIDIDGEPVFEGLDIRARIDQATDDSPFLIVGSISARGWANCPIPTDLPSSLLSTCDGAYGFESNKGGETYQIGLVFDDPDLATSASLIVLRVHVHDARATSCPSAYRERCEQAVVVEARAWPTPSATPSVGVQLDERGMPNEIDGEHVFEGWAIPRRIEEARDSNPFLILGRLRFESTDCFVPPDYPSTPLLRPCNDGTVLQSTKNGETYWGAPILGDLGGAPGTRSIVLRVHVHDSRAADCPSAYREQCERAVVADEVVWPTGGGPLPAATPTPVPTPTASPLADLETEIVDERDGIRVTVAFARNPFVAAELNSVDVEVRNIGSDDVVWLHDGCGIAAGVSARMPNAAWPAGVSQVGVAATFKEKALAEAVPGDPIRFSFEPGWALGGSDAGCADIGIEERIGPGKSLHQQLLWDGYAWGSGVPPPAGPVDLSVGVGHFSRASAQDRPRQSWHIDRQSYAWVTGESASPAISPASAVDAALATPNLITWLEPKMFGNIEPVAWFDPDIDAWQVGAVDHLTQTLHVVLIDASTGGLRGVIDRHWDEDGYP